MNFSRGSGILLHPTSLPGPHGSGDFGVEAYAFVDWLASAGQTLWQMLPLGGVGAGNSPYVSSSAFAGNPLLVDLRELQSQGWLSEQDLTADPAFDPARVDFSRMHPFRMERLRRASAAFARQADSSQRADYAAFCSEQAGWLDDYALFMVLAEHHAWASWTRWEGGLAQRDPQALALAREVHAAAVHDWKFIQWCFQRQWLALKRHANQRGVRIVGDVPIFIAQQSAEVWARPDLFELDAAGEPRVVAGVPPDYFSATGQRWGNPLYRWEVHRQEGYAWWIARLRHAVALADVVRIDHFRGFAGYWEIPAEHDTALHGRWQPGPGSELFAALQAALGKLPLIAEDLGVITPDVLTLREQFGLPGMCILQFAFGGEADGSYLPHNYQRNCVVYTGTHDNDTSQGWWASASAHERGFAARYLDCDGSDIHWDLIRAACASVAVMAIYPLQDVLGLDSAGRMNLPGEASGYWEWRFVWEQIEASQAERLAVLSALHGRCAFAQARLGN